MESRNVDFALPFAALISSLSQLNLQWYNFNIALSAHKQQQDALVIFRVRRRKSRQLFWTFPRPVGSWLEFTLYDEGIPEREFKKRLRMSKDTFCMLVKVCQENIVRSNTKLRACLPPDNVENWRRKT